MSSTTGPALAKLVSATFRTFHGIVHAEAIASTPWASITFQGARHRLRVQLEGAGAVGAAADFLERLPDLELPLPGAIVADIALLSDARRDGGGYACLELEALTIDDL